MASRQGGLGTHTGTAGTSQESEGAAHSWESHEDSRDSREEGCLPTRLSQRQAENGSSDYSLPSPHTLAGEAGQLARPCEG